jgi:hypothetical protein
MILEVGGGGQSVLEGCESVDVFDREGALNSFIPQSLHKPVTPSKGKCILLYDTLWQWDLTTG